MFLKLISKINNKKQKYRTLYNEVMERIKNNRNMEVDDAM